MDRLSSVPGNSDETESPADNSESSPAATDDSPAPSSQAAWQQELLEAHTSVRSVPRIGADKRLPLFDEVERRYPVRIPAYYLSLIDPKDPNDPIARMCMPDQRELSPCSSLTSDPLNEEEHTAVERLVHRYRDRALLIATSTCAMYCRFCTRKRLAGRAGGRISNKDLGAAVDYLRAHPEIKDVIVSGGDPLTLSDAHLAQILSALRAVPSIDIIRVGTRMPAVLPSRITPALVRTLARFHPLFVNTHFNHPRELTKEAVAACGRLADAGIPLGNQTVLLAGVNDRADVLSDLMRGLVKARVRPYYLFQCDLTEGIEHLRTPLSKGIEMMEALRGRLSGIAIPTFVVDGPHGFGKVPIVPNYIVSQAPGRTVLRNFIGKMVMYPDPAPQPNNQELGLTPDGVGGLLSGCIDIINGTELHDPAQVKPSHPQKSGSRLRVGLAFNLKRDADNELEASFDSPDAVSAVEDAIRSFNYEVVRLEANASFPVKLAEAKPDLVFNIAAGLHGRSREAQVPTVCEMLGVEYTGSDPLALSAGLDNAITKRLLREASVPTPAFFLVNGSPSRVPSGVSFPVIVKPNAEGSRKGVGVSSLARTSDELSAAIAKLRVRYGLNTPLIVEKFIYGREITVALLAKSGKLIALEPMEVMFPEEDSPRLYAFDLRQNGDGKYGYQCPAKLDEKLSRSCKNLATRAAAAVSCRDIGRVDFRIDERGKAWVIEINLLPGLTRNVGDMRMIAEASGLNYRELVGRILEAAVLRLNGRRKG